MHKLKLKLQCSYTILPCKPSFFYKITKRFDILGQEIDKQFLFAFQIYFSTFYKCYFSNIIKNISILNSKIMQKMKLNKKKKC